MDGQSHTVMPLAHIFRCFFCFNLFLKIFFASTSCTSSITEQISNLDRHIPIRTLGKYPTHRSLTPKSRMTTLFQQWFFITKKWNFHDLSAQHIFFETKYAIIQHETRCRYDIKLRTEIPGKVKGKRWIMCIFTKKIPGHHHHFPWLSMTLAVFHEFPGLENGLTKFHDFQWLSRKSGHPENLTSRVCSRSDCWSTLSQPPVTISIRTISIKLWRRLCAEY